MRERSRRSVQAGPGRLWLPAVVAAGLVVAGTRAIASPPSRAADRSADFTLALLRGADLTSRLAPATTDSRPGTGKTRQRASAWTPVGEAASLSRAGVRPLIAGLGLPAASGDPLGQGSALQPVPQDSTESSSLTSQLQESTAEQLGTDAAPPVDVRIGEGWLPAGPLQVADVEMVDNAFRPTTVTVTVGTTVRWTNSGSALHTTTSDGGLWNAVVVPGGQYTAQFNTAGAYPYHCVYHAAVGMTGRVVVTTGAPPPTPGPQPSLDGEIVFSDYGTSRSESRLFTVAPDGGNRAALPASGAMLEGQPSWSPEGARVAFTGMRSAGVWFVHILDRATGASTAISSGPEDYEPDWNPDGGRIVFSRYLRQNNRVLSSGIWLMAPDGSGQRPILVLEGDTYVIGNPVWSPDGSHIAFTVGSIVGGELYVMNADGSDARRLLAHPGWDDIDPAWSPDGRSLAFASGISLGGSVRHDIWVYDLESRRVGTVAAHTAYDLRGPAWSPDGRHLVFSAQTSSAPATRFNLYRLDGDTGQVVGPLTTGVEPDWARRPTVPTVTPGGPTLTPEGTPSVPPFPTFPPGTAPPPPPFPTPGPPEPTSTGPAPTFPAMTDTAVPSVTPLAPTPTQVLSGPWRIFAPSAYNEAPVAPGG